MNVLEKADARVDLVEMFRNWLNVVFTVVLT